MTWLWFAIVETALIVLLILCARTYIRYPAGKAEAELEAFRVACRDLQAEFEKVLLPPLRRAAEQLASRLVRTRR